METTIKAFCFILILTSCSHSNEKVKVNLLNISKIEIDSVVISVNKSRLNFTNINPTQKLSKTFNVKKSGDREGAFVINLYANDSLKNSGTFGYFSSPSEIKSEYTVTVFDDLQFREN